MAKNGPKGGGRIGAVDDRSQVLNSHTDLWVERNTASGRFINVKTSSNKPFKGVRKER